MMSACQIISKTAILTAAQCIQPVSVSAQEGHVVDDGDVNEMVCLLYHSGNGFKIIAAIFGDENIWGGLSSQRGKQQRQLT